MKTGTILILVVVGAAIGLFVADQMYVGKLKKEFLNLERQRVITTNKLTTAKIVSENLNHVRELVFENMDFAGQTDTVSHETHFFDFITECVNDLKLKVLSVRPQMPTTEGRITTFGYELEIEGDFFKFGELCAKLENSRRIVSLEEFEVSLKDTEETEAGGPGRKEIKVKMNVRTYRVEKESSAPITTTTGT